MAGKFEVYEDKAGKYRFRLKAGSGEIVVMQRMPDGRLSVQGRLPTA